MNHYQHTLQGEVSLSGVGLHSGQEVNLRLKPAEVNTGIRFCRVDIEGQPIIPADVDLVVSIERGTTLEKNGVQIATVEHLMAALSGLQIDNVIIEIDAVEIPILDGSSKPFIDAIEQVGLKEQNEQREYFEIRDTIKFFDEEKDVEMLAMPSDSFKVTVLIDYQSDVLGQQHASLDNINQFATDYGSARTFCFLHELEYLVDSGLIKGGDLGNAIVVVDRKIDEAELENLRKIFDKPDVRVEKEGILNNITLRYPNEPARHKLLDVVGDLALIGMPIKGNILATKPGHKTNVEFAQQIKALIKKARHNPPPPAYDPNAEPVFDLPQIEAMMPHRYPFLLIDKIIELNDKEVVGVKNVTFNEPFFRGHFPGKPIMPGVLQIEAMAQCGGILALNEVDNPADYDTFFLKITQAKFKRMVVPGDTMLLKLMLLRPVRRGIVEMKGTVYVGNKIAAEAELMAKIQKKN